MRSRFIGFSLLAIIAIALVGHFLWTGAWWLYIVVGPIVIIGIHDLVQKEHAILRNFPVVGHGRYIADWLHPKIYQYFVEPDYDGRPFNRLIRSVIYQRAKDTLDTNPFGTQLDVYEVGYEWLNHSIAAIDAHKLDQNPRVSIGGDQCAVPYHASLLNISAMSFGSLSKNAILALNSGAKKGQFAHNTGEGGISPHHLAAGGDLIYQLGTGYFGSRTHEGEFSAENFSKKANLASVRMIEVKLSQGAKPGHGGILPGKKVTPEIAAIRGVPIGKDVISPPHHTAFTNPIELLEFVQTLRELSSGKPVGFKLCVGHKAEFLSICKAIIATGIKPDFITVDGGEGGTGAAPLEFSNAVGMPFMDGLAFVYNALEGFGIKKDIRLISSGKIATGAHIFRALALGADLCNSARAMMMALGCIQALECNTNTCPTGVATQNPVLMKGLAVTDKSERVYHYHKNTVESFVELMAAGGIADPDQINRSHVYRRVAMNRHERYNNIYPYISTGCLLDNSNVPDDWRYDMSLADEKAFMAPQPLRKLHL